MARYYYLVASLPLLSYDSERIPSRDEFLDTCRQHLSAHDYRLVASASTADLQPVAPTCRTLDLWRRWETALRNELVRLRAKKKKAEAEGYLLASAGNIEAQGIAREAFDQESPLQAEDVLNRARWGYLDELEVGHYFDVAKILIYALRLEILGRKALFEERKGSEMFEEIYGRILKWESM